MPAGAGWSNQLTVIVAHETLFVLIQIACSTISLAIGGLDRSISIWDSVQGLIANIHFSKFYFKNYLNLLEVCSAGKASKLHLRSPAPTPEASAGFEMADEGELVQLYV